MNRSVRLTEKDNVAVALRDTDAGEEIYPGVESIERIPEAHKMRLEDIPKGAPVVRYKVTLGYAAKDIRKGSWVSEDLMVLPEAPSLDASNRATDIVTDLPLPPLTEWMGYEVPGSRFAGTRNILAINTTVQCVAGVVNEAVRRIKRDLLPDFPNVDDVIAVNHAYGCGVAIDAKDSHIPQRIIRNIAIHPNFGGQFMLVSLGCEKFTPERFCREFPELNCPDNVIVLQEYRGFEAMTGAITEMAKRKLEKLNERKRVKLPLSRLLVGMQCGGSDAFSGVTANPAAGYASDMLVKGGATVMFSEVTEVRDAVHLLTARCTDRSVAQKMVDEMRWYDAYLNEGSVDRSANPTPGNKKGGLANIVEKAMGSMAKSGTSPIVEVLSPGERPSKSGLIFAATPASDLVCGPCQLASGMGLEVFMTGRGTPYSLAAAPVIKVSSRSAMKDMWFDIIDLDAGPAATGEKTVAEIGEELFRKIVRVASGERTFSEIHGISNDLCVFNPAPIT